MIDVEDHAVKCRMAKVIIIINEYKQVQLLVQQYSSSSSRVDSTSHCSYRRVSSHRHLLTGYEPRFQRSSSAGDVGSDLFEKPSTRSQLRTSASSTSVATPGLDRQRRETESTCLRLTSGLITRELKTLCTTGTNEISVGVSQSGAFLLGVDLRSRHRVCVWWVCRNRGHFF